MKGKYIYISIDRAWTQNLFVLGWILFESQNEPPLYLGNIAGLHDIKLSPVEVEMHILGQSPITNQIWNESWTQLILSIFLYIFSKRWLFPPVLPKTKTKTGVLCSEIPRVYICEARTLVRCKCVCEFQGWKNWISKFRVFFKPIWHKNFQNLYISSLKITFPILSYCVTWSDGFSKWIFCSCWDLLMCYIALMEI